MPDPKFKSKSLSPILGLMLIFLNVSPLAQAHAQDCGVVYEAVTRLEKPEPGTDNIWSSLYKEIEGASDFVAAIESEEQGLLAIGHLREDSLRPAILSVKFDGYGRAEWHEVLRVAGLKQIVKALPHDDGFVLLANIEQKNGKNALWLGFFDGQAKLKSKNILNDKRFDLEARDFIAAHEEDDGWLVSVNASYKVGSGETENIVSNASIYRLDKNGNETFSREYYMGRNSEILGLSIASSIRGGPEFLATGYFENDSGKKKGWVFSMADDLSLKWQKEFGRGLSAKLMYVTPFDRRHMLVWGDVDIANSDLRGRSSGAWLMMLDKGNGEVIWQRYYMADEVNYDYHALDLFKNEDRTISAILSAKLKPKKMKGADEDSVKGGDYIQSITLSILGLPVRDEAFYFGSGARAYDLLVRRDGTRVLVGAGYSPAKTMFEKSRKDHHKEESDKEPLREYGRVQLPDVDVPEKAKKGLALLQNKIDQQDVVHDPSDKESAKLEDGGDQYIWRGWAVVSKKPDTYIDPCFN